MIEFKLPSLGADMEEGTLLEWKIKPGDAVKRGQVVAVVDTAKAAIDIESWQEGTVHKFLVQPHNTVPVGTPIALFLAPGEQAPSKTVAKSASTASTSKGKVSKKKSPLTAKTTRTTGAPRRAAAVRADAVPHAKISPAARKRAKALNVDLGRLAEGSGPGGSVIIADVERAAQEPASLDSSAATAAPGRAVQMRLTIAAAMSRSKREIPH